MIRSALSLDVLVRLYQCASWQARFRLAQNLAANAMVHEFRAVLEDDLRHLISRDRNRVDASGRVCLTGQASTIAILLGG